MPTIESRFEPTPPQLHFLTSGATVKGYGGAMGGGKTRTMCEAVLDYAIDFPGIQILVCRQKHTTIIETTKDTMINKVLGSLKEHLVAREKSSGGEDFIELHNGSKIHFIGLDDPVKWYSSEIGVLVFDEAHEIFEEDVIQMMARLRQEGMPHKTLVGFNPGNPGHWLQKWFILGAAETEFGFYKPEMFFTEGESPVGDCEFVFANAYANPYLPNDYIDRTLKSMKPAMRQRLLEGKWVLTDGSMFFDEDALDAYADELDAPALVGETKGDPLFDRKNPIGVRQTRGGPLAVWRPPVRKTDDHEAHRYLVSVDPSSGGSKDYTGIQVIDFEAFEQVAELQAKLDPDLIAIEAWRLASIYNGAMIAVERTGGWGYSVIGAIEKLANQWKGLRGYGSMPFLYTQRVEDRIAKKFTDILGWDTSTKTRMAMLDKLEEAIREREFRLHGKRTYTELTQFVWAKDKTGKVGGKAPAAQSGAHDDLVTSLAIAVYILSTQPRQLRRVRERPYEPLIGSTGY